MRFAAFNRACARLPLAFKTVQWRGAHVWKAGTPETFKMFAIGVPPSEDDEAPCPITLKVSEAIYPILLELDGVGQAPHLKAGGWLRINEPSAIDDETLAQHLANSHALAVASMTKKMRAALGLGAA